MNREKILVWDLPTRLFHWLLAGTFAGAWLTADSERWIGVHAALGYTFAGLIAFRLIWGVVGTRYARFSSFVRGPGAVLSYLKSLLAFRPQHHLGHNPAGGWAVLALLGLGIVTAAAGRIVAQVVLDLGLPRLEGLELLRRRRGRGDRTPVLILSARDALEDRVTGLDVGADDYMVKPFRVEELAARLRALVRRAHGVAAPTLCVAGVTLDPWARSVSWHGRPVELPAREFDVLHELMLNAGRVLSREHLQGRVYRWGEEVESNAIDVHVHHLRRKLAPELIRTIRGVGYVLAR